MWLAAQTKALEHKWAVRTAFAAFKSTILDFSGSISDRNLVKEHTGDPSLHRSIA